LSKPIASENGIVARSRPAERVLDDEEPVLGEPQGSDEQAAAEPVEEDRGPGLAPSSGLRTGLGVHARMITRGACQGPPGAPEGHLKTEKRQRK
jgi:hypothetical protein